MLKAWSGPALAVFGAVAVLAIEVLPATSQSTLAWWILKNALSPVRILPMLGLGVALGLAKAGARVASLVLFGGGLVVGFVTQDRFVAALASFPLAGSHDFLTGPISCLIIGLALVAGLRISALGLPAAAAIAGAMLIFAIRVTDPTLHDPAIALAGITISAWIVSATAITVHAFRRDWFAIGSRILGSWLIAIGLLYGGASLIPKSSPAPLPPAAKPSEGLPGLEREVPGLPAPDGGSADLPPGRLPQ